MSKTPTTTIPTFDAIYHTYQNLMFRVAMNILKNKSDAEDAVQLACIKIADNLEKLTDIHCAKTKGYIITITENKAVDIYRQNAKKNHLEYNADFIGFTIPCETDDRLAGCILRLPVLYREMIMLRYYYGYKMKEVADLMDISLANAYKTEQRAKKRLKELCQKEGILE